MMLTWGARTAALFRTAIEGDGVEERTARLLRGHPLSLLGLTQAGRSPAADMGLETRRGLSELLAGHRTPEQALLAPMTRALPAQACRLGLLGGDFKCQKPPDPAAGRAAKPAGGQFLRARLARLPLPS